MQSTHLPTVKTLAIVRGRFGGGSSWMSGLELAIAKARATTRHVCMLLVSSLVITAAASLPGSCERLSMDCESGGHAVTLKSENAVLLLTTMVLPSWSLKPAFDMPIV